MSILDFNTGRQPIRSAQRQLAELQKKLEAAEADVAALLDAHLEWQRRYGLLQNHSLDERQPMPEEQAMAAEPDAVYERKQPPKQTGNTSEDEETE